MRGDKDEGHTTHLVARIGPYTNYLTLLLVILEKHWNIYHKHLLPAVRLKQCNKSLKNKILSPLWVWGHNSFILTVKLSELLMRNEVKSDVDPN